MLKDLQMFSVSPTPTKFLFKQRTPISLRKPRWSYVYDGNKEILTFFRLLGTFPISRDKNGSIEFKLFSYWSLYTIIILSAYTAMAVILSYYVVANYVTNNFTFNESTQYLPLLSFPMTTILVLLSFVEAKKVARYLQDWEQFQNMFEAITNRNLPHPPKYKKYVILVMMVFLFISFFSIFWFTRHKFGQVIERYGLDVRLYTCLAYVAPISGVFFLGFGFTWYIFTKAVKTATNCLISDIESFRWTKSKTLKGHLHLWLQLRHLCLSLGNILWIRTLYISLMLFIISLPLIYNAVININNASLNEIVGPITQLAFITLIGELAYQTEEKLGSEFEIRLLKLMQNGKAIVYEEQIVNFIRTVASTKPVISLGGYVTMNRGINVALYSNVITYAVIISQYTLEVHPQMQDTTSTI